MAHPKHGATRLAPISQAYVFNDESPGQQANNESEWRQDEQTNRAQYEAGEYSLVGSPRHSSPCPTDACFGQNSHHSEQGNKPKQPEAPLSPSNQQAVAESRGPDQQQVWEERDEDSNHAGQHEDAGQNGPKDVH